MIVVKEMLRLIEKPRQQWSMSALRLICKSDMFVNNHYKVFNNSIRKYRDLSTISTLKSIQNDVMRRIIYAQIIYTNSTELMNI